MSDHTNGNIWPVPKFSFQVDLAGIGVINCQEISGLDNDQSLVEYRAGNSAQFNTVRMPGLQKGSDITIKRGIAQSSTAFDNYLQQIQTGNIRRQQVVIKLMNDQQQTTFQWTLANAYPVKITLTDLKSDEEEIAIEEMTLAFESMSISTP